MNLIKVVVELLSIRTLPLILGGSWAKELLSENQGDRYEKSRWCDSTIGYNVIEVLRIAICLPMQDDYKFIFTYIFFNSSRFYQRVYLAFTGRFID